jgi:organic hydroperoxide reductase OsmC/OhrA
MGKRHDFAAAIVWTGNRGQGTSHYRGYDRTWDIALPAKDVIHCSNDPMLGGDPSKMNPEDLLLSSLAACHMLWYLHLASDAGIVVTEYRDNPVGHGETLPNGAGRFLSAVLKPEITIRAGADLAVARTLHERVHEYCFIARSVNFPVSYEPLFKVGPA